MIREWHDRQHRHGSSRPMIHDRDERARVAFAMWCALCAAAGDLLAERCAHDDVGYVNGTPLARWVMRRLSRAE